MHAAGYVYGFTSPSMPGLVNIGATDRDPSERLAEANASPGCPPEPYVAAYTAAVGSALATVRGIHALLEARPRTLSGASGSSTRGHTCA